MEKLPKSIKSIFSNQGSVEKTSQNPSSPTFGALSKKSLSGLIKSHLPMSGSSGSPPVFPVSDVESASPRSSELNETSPTASPIIPTLTPLSLNPPNISFSITANDNNELNEPSKYEEGGSKDSFSDSDDHDEDQDQDVTKKIKNPSVARVHSHMSHADAQSIIGGISIDEDSIVAEEHTHIHDPASNRNTFSFSLPFSNPLAGFKLPSFFSNQPQDDEANISSRENYLTAQHEIGDLLHRQMSVTSLQEDLAYNTVKEQDNSRLRAVKRALTPSIISSNKPSEPLLTDFKGTIVIMGGYRGSILRDKSTGRRVWIPLKAGFNLRKIDLTVGINDEDEYEMENKIYPDGMLTHIGPVDIARKLIKRLRAIPDCQVYEFGYDWRLSCDIISEKLTTFIKELPSPPIIIAHSMGGLIAHHAMNKDPTIVRGILYAGSPSQCPNILGPLRNGDSILLSSKILTAQVNFLMRSSYVFLPLSGRCFVNKKDHRIKYDLDFFDVNTWIRYELSPLVTPSRKDLPKNVEEKGKNSFHPGHKRTQSDSFIAPDQLHISYDDAVRYLDRTLKRTKKFLKELEFEESKAHLYPPLACLYSYCVPTLKGALVDSKEDISTDTYENFLFGPGDGVVYYKWVMPEPMGFEVVAKIPTENGHVSLLTDVDAVLRALDAILKNEKERKSRPESAETTSKVPGSPGD
ncbi:uncharacterized protein SAPINGB_P004765 [Magnusiomyces paraingens]|uniref:Uncharacterized protein n=1 Tax=Magnusiomyces paraingens TaxID=2606893 RepID=A0A5E8BXK7_9ASCO|nr:uncharacterized protein SAPINGB_P004765 [Saprochaete ingens]VVT55841.1 unnamed protein product [Saprochaete ingens]